MKQIRLLFLMTLCLFLKVQLHAQIDTFATLIGAPVNTAGWNMVGQAKVAKIKYTDSSEVLLCPTNVTFTSGGIFYNQPINLAKCSRWVADFDFRIFDGNSADGLTFCFLDKPPAGFVIGQGLGIPQNSSGLKVCFDTWNNCQCNGGYQVPKLEIRWGLGYSIQNSSGSGVTCWDSTKTGNGECNAVGYPTIYNTGGNLDFIRSTNYNHATIKYDRGTVSVYLNGTLFSSVTIPVGQQPLFAGYLGFTSATGSNYDNHSIRNVIIKSDIPPSYAGPAKTICHGKIASLGAAGDTTFKYNWSPSTGLSSSTVANPTVTLTNNSLAPISQKYFISTAYDSATTCVTVDSVVVTVNPYPHLNNILGNKNICFNKTSQFTNDSTGGTWVTNNPLTASTSNAGLVTGNKVDTTTLKYFVTNSYGCIDSVSALLNVRPTPLIDTIAGLPAVCATHTITLTNDTLGGVWTSLNNTFATIGSSSGILNGLSAGKDTVRYTVTSAFACVDSVSRVITINPLPTINSIGGTNTVCFGKTTQLTNATLGGTWISTNPAIASVDNTGKVMGNAAGSATIRYIVVNSFGCSDSVATSITVNSLPVIAPIGGNPAVCIGKNTQLTETTNGGSWVSVNTGIATIDNTGKITTITAAADTIRYIVTNGNGCTDSVFAVVTVNSLPVISTIGGSNSICLGKTTQLTETTIGGSWISNSTSVATVDNTGLVTANNAGSTTIRYIVTNKNGCTDSVSLPVTVNSLPVIAPINGTPNTCIGKSTQLIETTSGGTWLSTNTGVATIDNNGKITTVAAGIDTIRYILNNGAGCTDSVKTLFTVNSLPSINSIGGVNSVCTSKTTQLNNTTPGGIWTSTNTTIATVNNNGLVTGNTAGIATIKYTVTNGAGCVDSVASSIIVNIPTTSSTATSVCPSALPYSWNGNTYNAAGSYTVHLTNAVGCDSAATLVLSLKPVSTSTTNTSVCPSALPYSWNGNSYNTVGSFTVHLTNAVGCDSAATLVLSLKPVSTSTTNISVCPSAIPYNWNGNTYNTVGSYTVHLTNAVGCDSAATLVLSLKPVSTSTTNISVCSSALPYSWNGNTYNTVGSYTVHLTNAVGCDSAATLNLSLKQTSTSTTTKSVCSNVLPYSWNGNFYNATGTYTVHLTNAVGCDSAATLNLIVEDFKLSLSLSQTSSAANPLPVGTPLTVQISANNTISSSIWEPATLFGNNQSAQTVIVADSFTLVVIGNSPEGCIDTASEIVYVNPANNLFIPNAIVPSNNDTRINSFMIYGTSVKTAELNVFNQWGQKIFHSDDAKSPMGKGWDGKFNGQLQPTGVYVYTVKITYLNNKTETRSGSINLIR